MSFQRRISRTGGTKVKRALDVQAALDAARDAAVWDGAGEQLAGVLAASRLSSAQPTGGADIELQAIAAVIIGVSLQKLQNKLTEWWDTRRGYAETPYGA